MTQYSWTVIGAGPAGIAAVGRLLDHGIVGEQIAWIDPEFDIADAFHPRQRVFTDPAVVTHPRQTLINPAAPAARAITRIARLIGVSPLVCIEAVS